MWTKKGLIFTVDGRHDWNKSHAQLPIVDASSRDFWRIYYASRNEKGQSNISYFDVQAGVPEKIIYVHDLPVLEFGKLGTFDESGLMPVGLVSYKNDKYLYYAGWSLRKTIPYHNTIGLAISGDNGKTYQKLGEGPIFDTTPQEAYSNGTIHVLREDGVWKAWYQSIINWKLIENRAEPFYHLKYSVSEDGINWTRKGDIAIELEEGEAGICSATVVKENNKYRMWYSVRKNGDYRNNKNCSYRIGYAESLDGLNWKRLDAESGINISKEGWDSEMVAYPNICYFQGTKYMFYNGNGFGKSGIGYAVSSS